jgi:hypothetical protein
MKKIETTNIAALAKAPYLKATHDQYTETIQETTASIIKGLLGPYTTGDVIILHGCVVTATIPGTSSVTAGAIYYNGEIYQVDANASIATAANTLVWNTVTTYRSGDPVQWSDLTSRNLHAEVKFVLSNAVSGTGIANYNGATVKYMMEGAPIYKTSAGVSSYIPRIRTKVIEIGDWNMDSNGNPATAPVHGIADMEKIVNVSVLIRPNAATSVLPLSRANGATDGLAAGGFSINSTTLTLFRVTGGAWDDAAYNSTGFNRGWIYIQYMY